MPAASETRVLSCEEQDWSFVQCKFISLEGLLFIVPLPLYLWFSKMQLLLENILNILLKLHIFFSWDLDVRVDLLWHNFLSEHPIVSYDTYTEFAQKRLRTKWYFKNFIVSSSNVWMLDPPFSCRSHHPTIILGTSFNAHFLHVPVTHQWSPRVELENLNHGWDFDTFLFKWVLAWVYSFGEDSKSEPLYPNLTIQIFKLYSRVIFITLEEPDPA